jgi:cellobiose phosphorylase
MPRHEQLGLHFLASQSGLSIAMLPNGTLFSIEHSGPRGAVMINQVLGSPAYGGIGRLYLRAGGARSFVAEVMGPRADVSFGQNEQGFSWSGETAGIRHDVRLVLHPTEPIWLWRVTLENTTSDVIPADLVLLQDVGLGDRGFLMNSEAYASQYIDHHVADHDSFGFVVMNRQNLKQGQGCNPWVAQGCLEGAVGYATDAIQLNVATSHKDQIVPDFGTDLPSKCRQHEVTCPALQSRLLSLVPSTPAGTSFFGFYVADHPDASSDADLSRLDVLRQFTVEPADTTTNIKPVRSIIQDAPLAAILPLDKPALDRLYPERKLEEWLDCSLLSFFVPDGRQNRHVVLKEKELQVARRHGALVRSGQNMLPDDRTLAATCWMQGIFAAQLTIGNTSFHKLFSVSRDPYNLMRASGLRILVDTGQGWQLLAVPSLFEMGLGDCSWIYRFSDRTVTIAATVSGDDPAMQWTISVEGAPCRFLIFGHVVLGEREYEGSGRIVIDGERKRIAFRPDPGWLWGQRFPDAAYCLITSTPDAVQTVGGDELLYSDGVARNGPFVTLLSHPTNALAFTVTGSMTDATEGERLAERYESGVPLEDMRVPASQFWDHVTRGISIDGEDSDLAAQATILPWLAHDAIVHLSVPHGLEQYTGAAWGTRDVCQGPIEFLLAYEHDSEAKQILKIVFSEQYRDRGDWPQWFMLDPYANIRAGESHGDIVVWPLKALCDYLEATDDIDFLDETTCWRVDDTLEKTTEATTIAEHIEKLLETVRSRFIPGTSLIRYGEGDWNDSLQPADPHLREWMVSSWTVALLYEQVLRYAAILRRRGEGERAEALEETAAAMAKDFNRHLIRDGIVAGYGVFDPTHDGVELLLHPDDRRTGLSFSLIAMTQAMIGRLFTPEQRRDHMKLIREHLLFPDGVRLMEKPAIYSGGPERLFRRAESASFFGREIGLMYVHAHLRYCEVLAMDGDIGALWESMALVNPISVTENVANASLRQRNTYFSSSDAAFHDRYHATAEWERVKAGEIAVDGGWRIYSSGPGLYTKGLVCNAFGFKREWGNRIRNPLLPKTLAPKVTRI